MTDTPGIDISVFFEVAATGPWRRKKKKKEIPPPPQQTVVTIFPQHKPKDMHHVEKIISARYGLEYFSKKIEEYWPEESIDVTALAEKMITNGSIFLADRSLDACFTQKNKYGRFNAPFAGKDKELRIEFVPQEKLMPAQIREMEKRGGRPEIDMPVHPIKNFGNWCYLNSVMQCLAHTMPLRHYYINKLWKKDLQFKNELGTKGQMSKEFSKILSLYFDNENSVLDLHDLRRCLANHVLNTGERNL